MPWRRLRAAASTSLSACFSCAALRVRSFFRADGASEAAFVTCAWAWLISFPIEDGTGSALQASCTSGRSKAHVTASNPDAPRSAGPDPGNLADILGEDDPQLEHTLDMESVWAHWSDLPMREQRLLMMRFYGNMTQAEIGERLGISQMHVSRLLAGALSYLRERVLGQDSATGQR